MPAVPTYVTFFRFPCIKLILNGIYIVAGYECACVYNSMAYVESLACLPISVVVVVAVYAISIWVKANGNGSGYLTWGMVATYYNVNDGGL